MNDAYLRVQRLVRWHIVVLSAILFAGGAVILFYHPPLREAPFREEIPRPLAQGRQIYKVMSGGTGPKITEVTVDPFDPKVGSHQIMEINASHTNNDPVVSASIVLFTDQSSSSYPFALASGDGTNGTWRAEWATTATHLTTYRATLYTSTAHASSSIELHFR